MELWRGVITYLCDQMLIPYTLLSRKNTKGFKKLSLINKVRSEEKTIVVNCCSRDYVFNGEIDKEIIFWDLNYSFEPHKTLFSSMDCKYIDGLELLNLQANML